MPNDTISSGDSILIRFRSDDSIHNKGFTVTYSAIEANENEQYITSEKQHLNYFKHGPRFMERYISKPYD